MSLPERRFLPAAKLRGPALVAGLIVAFAALPACTVRPLYSTAPASVGQASPAAELASIAIEPVSTRVAQEVRNHLIFLFAGGAGEPASPRYRLSLAVASSVTSADTVSSTTSMVVMSTGYVLREAETGKEVARGSRQVSSAFDVPKQEFAALRAKRDAENRAARELAEMVNLAVAQDLTRIGLN